MAKIPVPYTAFNGGIADFIRDGIANSFAFGRSIDVRSDPQNITVLPRTVKESGNTITDLPKWAETYLTNLTTYIYGDTGNLYSRSSSASYTFLRTVPTSHGNGLVYSAEDDFLYYTGDKVVGRYGPLASSTPTFVDDFFGSQGGVPLNTNALDLESSSSQYASRADTASLSITGNIACDVQIKPESLPTSGNQMVLVSKWDESAALRSYKFDIAAVSGYFGDGSDGALTISVDTTEAPIDSACTGTLGASTLSATNVSFAAGQIIFIHQTRAASASGTWERNKILSYTAGTITLDSPLMATYITGAQVRVLKQYTNVTINSGVTYTAKAYDDSVGGIIAFIASGTVTVSGTITASAKGYLNGPAQQTGGSQLAVGPASGAANGGAGRGAVSNQYGSGGGGAYALNGSDGASGGGSGYGAGGISYGTADLTNIHFGSGGGGGGGINNGGGDGGGGVFITATSLVVTGGISANGENGGTTTQADSGGSGGGAGGGVLIKVQTATLGASLITASGGTGSAGLGIGATGGNGSVGRIHIDYYTSYTGTTSPTINPTQDNTLVTNTSYQLRLSLSSTGSNTETLTSEITPLIGSWQQVGVSWTASTSTAIFYLNAVAQSTRTGTLIAINDNASTFQIGMSKNGAGAAANFYDGLLDEVRVFNATRSASDMIYGINQQIATNTTGLVAYYKLNNNYNDATANANNLAATNAPVFTTDVPYPSPTTRLDIDQSATTNGNTYTTPVAISEATTERKTFTPAKDPQKSLAVTVAAVGTGDWTVTVHDSFNNAIASKTVANASMTTGSYEFVFTTPWRPLTNFTNTYHFHVTSTVADGTVTTGSANDLETVSYKTYYQFLVTDTAWHPMARLLNFWVVGNGRWIGKYEATLYEPNKIGLGAAWTVRCIATWREFTAFGCFQGSTISDFDKGRIYFWDGIAPTFNFHVDVHEGGINAMIGSGDKLFIWAGYKNQLLVYGWSFQGGGSATKLKDLPKMETGKYSEIYPQAVTMWQSLLRYGVAGNGDSTAIQKGVYTYGSTNIRYPDILTYDYPISTGTLSGTTTKIGLVTVVNKKLLVGWQDNISYGVDYVDTSNAPFPLAMVEFLITDSEAVWKQKEAVEVDANFTTLLTGEAISLRYALDGSTTFTSNLDPTSTGDTVSRLLIPTGRYNEAQVGIDITSTTTAPTIKGVVLVTDMNETEARFG